MPEPTIGATTEFYLKAIRTRNCNYTENCNYVVPKIVRTQVDGEIHSAWTKKGWCRTKLRHSFSEEFDGRRTDSQSNPSELYCMWHSTCCLLIQNGRGQSRESNPWTSKQLTPVWLKRSRFVWFSIKKQNNNNFLVWVQRTTQQHDLLSAEKQATGIVEVPRRRLAAHRKGFFSSNLLWRGLSWVIDRPTKVRSEAVRAELMRQNVFKRLLRVQLPTFQHFRDNHGPDDWELPQQ